MCHQHTTNWADVQPCKKYFFVVFAGLDFADARPPENLVSSRVLDLIRPILNGFLAARPAPGAGPAGPSPAQFSRTPARPAAGRAVAAPAAGGRERRRRMDFI